MTEMRTHSTFTADFPDDIVWGEDEELEVAGGRNVLTAIAGLLRDRGFQVTEPEEHSFYGWAFTATKGKETFWFMLQWVEKWLLISEARRGFMDRLLKRPTSHREALEELNAALRGDPRFGEISWYTGQEFDPESAGAAAP